MARWNVRERQKLVDDYLNASGANMFVPREFLEWMRPQEDHPYYDVFFGRSDEELAQEAREGIVRRFASGLRVKVEYSAPEAVKGTFKVVEQPLYISPVGGRRGGGGYVQNDGTDAETQDELRRQAAAALDAWRRRYGGVAEVAGVDITPIEEIAALLTGGVAIAA